MALKTTFVVQTFELKRKRVVPGGREVAPTESGALKKAQAVAGRMPGAAAGLTVCWGEQRDARVGAPLRRVSSLF